MKACLKNPFFKYYFSEAASSAFQSLYDNVNGIQDAFAGFWQTVASFFKNSDHVIGYEILNEPWPGDIYKDLKLLVWPGKADKENLVPMYERVASAIRLVDDEHLIFFEPAVTDGALLGYMGFERVPGGPLYNNRSVLSYHVYCGLTNPDGDPYNVGLCSTPPISAANYYRGLTLVLVGADLVDRTLINSFVKDYTGLGGGGMLTEFGASYDDPAAIQQVNEMCDDADSALQSWAWWQFKDFQDITTASEGPLESFYDADGSLQLPKVQALSRTYAYAVAGIPLSMTFNTTTSAFNFKYRANPTIGQPTLVYLNQQWWYPKGFKVAITPTNVVWKQLETNRIAISHPASISPSTVVQVTIVPL